MPTRAPRLASAIASGRPTWPHPPMTTASAAVRTFGPAAQVLHPAGYTVLVWNKNLLAGLR